MSKFADYVISASVILFKTSGGNEGVICTNVGSGNVKQRCQGCRWNRDNHEIGFTEFLSTPMPWIFTSTTSFGCMGPTPTGVPVLMMSPG